MTDEQKIQADGVRVAKLVHRVLAKAQREQGIANASCAGGALQAAITLKMQEGSLAEVATWLAAASEELLTAVATRQASRRSRAN